MTFPKISIVTPSFNQGNFIEQTILSIINQNYPNLEYIIIDGGSTDNTVEIIRKYADLITYWVSEPDNGQSHAINKGLERCTGELFNWINSDDYLEDGALLEIGKKYLETKAHIICGYTSIFNDFNKNELQKHRTQIFLNVEETIVQQKINQPAMFYKVEVVKALGGVNTNLNFVMDLELWFRYLSAYGQNEIVLIENLIAHFRIHEKSKTDNYQLKFRDEEKALLIYLTSKLNINKKWISFFNSEINYFPVHKFNVEKLNRKNFELALSEKYFYQAYGNGDYIIAKVSYFNLFRSKRLTVNFQNIAMFIKLFIVNIPFRKFFKNGT